MLNLSKRYIRRTGNCVMPMPEIYNVIKSIKETQLGKRTY